MAPVDESSSPIPINKSLHLDERAFRMYLHIKNRNLNPVGTGKK
jgi:hypothetical protein